MSAHSFYLGPGKPVLRIAGWDDLVAAAQGGVLAETQWVELKAGLPADVRAANLEVGRDLASLSVDGGVLIVGVRDPGTKAEHVVGTTDDLENLKSRIDQVAGSVRVQPPLSVQMTSIDHPTDAERYVLIVRVPASTSAPHMVDEKYWGRGATGKRPLLDVEVSRLFAERRGRRDDFKARLEGLSKTVDPLPPTLRNFGHLYLLVEPEAAVVGPPLSDVVAGQLPLQVVLNSLSFNPQWSPSFESLRYPIGHPDGLALSSVAPGNERDQEAYLMYLLLNDGGSVQLASGQATRAYRDKMGIPVNQLMEIIHQALQLAAHLGSSYLHYAGMWRLGVHAQGLKGHLPGQALTESGIASFVRFTPFQSEEYTRLATATAEELADQTSVVVERLLRDLARGVGLQDRLFPYSRPADLIQRA